MEAVIKEGNELIVEFMGYVLRYIDPEHEMPYYVHNEKYLEHSIIRIDKGETLQYHSNWSWLMPVVEKIQEMVIPQGYEVCIELAGYSNGHKETSVTIGSKITVYNEDSKMAIFLAVVKFIKLNKK